jgi:hypothetical protein
LLVDLPVKNLISDSFVTFEFSNTGGVANSCSSEPDLPSGLAVPITSALILSILVFLNLSSKPLNAATSLPVVICSSVPSTKSILNKSMILLQKLD